MKDEQNAAESSAQVETKVVEEQDASPDLLELVLEGHERLTRVEPNIPARIDGVLVGKLVGFGATSEPHVEVPGRSTPIRARAAMALEPAHIGRNVALLFEGGDPEKPLVMGLMFEAQNAPAMSLPSVEHSQVDVETDGERLVFSAEKEIVLRCGQASITLTRAGKILIQGAYVLSRSSGTHRIQGGSVEIN